MGINVNIAGTIKDMSGGYVNIGGIMKPIDKAYCNIGGTLKEAYVSFAERIFFVDSGTSPYTFIVCDSDGNKLWSKQGNVLSSHYTAYSSLKGFVFDKDYSLYLTLFDTNTEHSYLLKIDEEGNVVYEVDLRSVGKSSVKNGLWIASDKLAFILEVPGIDNYIKFYDLGGNEIHSINDWVTYGYLYGTLDILPDGDILYFDLSVYNDGIKAVDASTYQLVKTIATGTNRKLFGKVNDKLFLYLKTSSSSKYTLQIFEYDAITGAYIQSYLILSNDPANPNAPVVDSNEKIYFRDSTYKRLYYSANHETAAYTLVNVNAFLLNSTNNVYVFFTDGSLGKYDNAGANIFSKYSFYTQYFRGMTN